MFSSSAVQAPLEHSVLSFSENKSIPLNQLTTLAFKGTAFLF